jgi:hypothetical protein
MNRPPRFYVRIDRADGSRTYKGPWVEAHSKREATAWMTAFPDYTVDVLAADRADVIADVKAWRNVIRDNDSPRYYPEPVTP